MAQVITGLDNIPISAASAAYAPTNTADVTAMIDSAVSAKLDASASSSFQPSGDYVSSSDLSGYLPTSSIGVDSASAVTSIAGSSIASGEQVVTSISTGGYGVSAINGRVINASHMVFGAAAENSSNAVKLGDSSYGAGVFLTGNFGTAYYKVNELQLNRNGTGFIGFNIGGAGSQITATSNAGGKFTAGGPNGARSYYTAYNDSASASIEVSADSAKINLADSGYTSTIYPSSIPHWNAKLDASSIETSVDGITGIGGTAIAGGGTTYTAGQYIQISGDEISVTGLQPSGDYVSSSDLADYQPTSSMSAYATTGDLSTKLDASASSSFITSTSDCMPLSSSSDYYSTSNPSGFVTSSYSPTFGYSNGHISSIDGTGLMGTDTAVVTTNTAQSFANIESGLPFEDTYVFDTPVTSIKITVPAEGGAEPWLNLNADNPAGNETVLAYAGTDSYYNYDTSLGGSGWTSISFYDTSYLTQGGIRGVSATGYSDGVTATAELMQLSASSNFYPTSNPAGYITGVDLTPYQTTAGMSGYLATSSIGVDTASAITSIAGSAIAGGGGAGGADWSAESGQPGYIENKPVPKTLVAGTGITITENSSELVVASTNALYSAGSGLTLSGTTFAVDTSVIATQSDLSGYATTSDLSSGLAGKQDTLTAGEGISISNSNVVSVDETVLFSSNGTLMKNGISISEPLTNFERIRFYVQSVTTSSNCTPSVVEIAMCGSAPTDGSIKFCFSNGHDLSSNFYLTWLWKVTVTSSTLTLTDSHFWGYNGNAAASGDNLNDATIFKVVGINRIASN